MEPDSDVLMDVDQAPGGLVTLNWGQPFSSLPETILPKVDGMMQVLDTYIPDALREHFARHAGLSFQSPIMSLLNSPDIWVDHIFPYFAVEDILAFGATCKDYYLLSKEPINWRRFLARMNLPVPQLRSSWRYEHRLHEFEVETIVTQSISVDKNWRSDSTRIYNEREMHVGHLTNDMFFVPGGRWMIASQMDRGKPAYPDRVRCWLYLYMLDHPNGPSAVARLDTFTRAYNVKARACNLRDGEDGLVITFNRRKPRRPQPPAFFDEDLSHDFDHNIDIPGGYDYNICTLYCSLNTMEYVKQPDIDHTHPVYKQYLEGVASPFRELGQVNSHYQFSHTDIHQYRGKTWIVALNLPHELHFINILDPKEHIVQILRQHEEYPNSAYRMRAFRMYPDSDSMILIRSCMPVPGGNEIHFVEWVDLPKEGTKGIIMVPPRTRYVYRPKKTVRNFTISDLGWPNRGKKHPGHPDLRSSSTPPPPISIYIEFENEKGLQHHCVFPDQVWNVDEKHPEGGSWKYTFRHTSWSMSIHMSHPDRAMVLPGAQRAVVCVLDGNDRSTTPNMVRLRRYNPPAWVGPEYLQDEDLQGKEDPEFPVTRKGEREPLAQIPFQTIAGSEDLCAKINALGGMRSIAWDEATGRIAIAANRDHTIRIIDTAQCTVPDGNSEDWKRRREWVRQELDRRDELKKLQDPERYR